MDRYCNLFTVRVCFLVQRDAITMEFIGEQCDSMTISWQAACSLAEPVAACTAARHFPTSCKPVRDRSSSPRSRGPVATLRTPEEWCAETLTRMSRCVSVKSESFRITQEMPCDRRCRDLVSREWQYASSWRPRGRRGLHLGPDDGRSDVEGLGRFCGGQSVRIES